MEECEDLVTLLLTSLARVRVQLTQKSLELGRRGEMFDLTETVEVVELNWNDKERRQLAIFGSVAGEIEGLGGLVWLFEITRDEAEWRVERELNLTNTTGIQKTLHELPVVICTDSTELATSLPSLVSDLLDLQSPQSSARHER